MQDLHIDISHFHGTMKFLTKCSLHVSHFLAEGAGSRDLGIADRVEVDLPASFDVVLVVDTDELEDHVLLNPTPVALVGARCPSPIFASMGLNARGASMVLTCLASGNT